MRNLCVFYLCTCTKLGTKVLVPCLSDCIDLMGELKNANSFFLFFGSCFFGVNPSDWDLDSYFSFFTWFF